MRAAFAALRMQESVRAYAARAEGARCGHQHPDRVELRRGGGALDRERPAHGLHRRGPDHAPGLAHGAGRDAGLHPGHPRHRQAGRRLRRARVSRAGPRQGPRLAHGGVRDHARRARRTRSRRPPPRGSDALRGAGGRGAPDEPRARAGLRRAHAGRVCVVGDPGVGKSRLLWEFIHSEHTRGCLLLEGQAASCTRKASYAPIIDLLRKYFAIEERQDLEGHPRPRREPAAGRDRSLEAFVPAFLALLDVPVHDREWAELDPLLRRARTIEGIRACSSRRASGSRSFSRSRICTGPTRRPTRSSTRSSTRCPTPASWRW